jgi:hypothetical protein
MKNKIRVSLLLHPISDKFNMMNISYKASKYLQYCGFMVPILKRILYIMKNIILKTVIYFQVVWQHILIKKFKINALQSLLFKSFSLKYFLKLFHFKKMFPSYRNSKLNIILMQKFPNSIKFNREIHDFII